MNEQEEIAPTLSQSQFLRLAIDTLAVRSARWATLFMAFSLFAWVVVIPDWKRLAAASAFTVLVHVPMWFRRGNA